MLILILFPGSLFENHRGGVDRFRLFDEANACLDCGGAGAMKAPDYEVRRVH
jgi:hypothetical protein